MKRGPSQNSSGSKRQKQDALLLDSLNDGIWASLASFLSLNEIQALKNTCSFLNVKLDNDVVWQPFLNRLHHIDKTIPATVQTGQKCKDAFIAGLENVRTRQLAEIGFLRIKHAAQIFANTPNIKQITPDQALNLGDLEAISAELDILNANIIASVIEEQKEENNKSTLNLIGITRFPMALIKDPAYEGYWKNLKNLNLSGNFLNQLPSNIGNKLQSLKILDCSNNQLTELPSSIGKLKALQVLLCNNNQIRALPSSIGDLHALKKLDTSENGLSELPSTVGKLKSLKVLNVSKNLLRALPNCIGELTLLKELWCERNQLSELPESIGKLKRLRMLSVSENLLAKLPESIGSLQMLEALYVCKNQLCALPACIGDLLLLKELWCENNQLTALPETIGNLQSLLKLGVRENLLTTLPDSICKLEMLVTLYIAKNKLSTLPRSFRDLRSLEQKDTYLLGDVWVNYVMSMLCLVNKKPE
ncbi:MAG: leucine-rich repeat domain-containing protein [Candidatus Berkiella sp.]